MDLDTRGGQASTLSLVVGGGEGQEGDSEVQGEEVMEGEEEEDMGEGVEDMEVVEDLGEGVEDMEEVVVALEEVRGDMGVEVVDMGVEVAVLVVDLVGEEEGEAPGHSS